MSAVHWIYSLKGFASLLRRSGPHGGAVTDTDLFRQKAMGTGLGTPAKAVGRQGWLRRVLGFRWLPLGNQRKGRPWVQTEMLLQGTTPLRHDLVEDDVALVRRERSKVIYESGPAAPTPPRFDNSAAYERLRNRAPLASRVVAGEAKE
ncbi:MAG TPA: hypothetical protein VMF06_18520 [Candidatus Limnocylindria bacterium]|jgi:hypothetical protein|nr:hypothetical protein [Candidatus Limnocylindria bacterium]